MNMFRLVLLVIFSFSALATEHSIPENVIVSWGYKTVSLDGQQKIKRLTKVVAKTMTIYPRFYLSKKCLSNFEDAQSYAHEIEADINSTKVGRIKNYTEMIIESNCVFTINTDSNYLALEFQPNNVRLVRDYARSLNQH
ncbi:MAG: hypothetical protein KUG78_08265 [Kangiellaceae bacterium]|nr:hypothetical protein [Kangiellaceae bacterium]